MKLTADQETYFMEMERTFDTNGFQLLLNGMQEEFDRIPEDIFYNAKSFEDVVLARERRSFLSDMLTLPQRIEAQKQAILETESDGDNG